MNTLYLVRGLPGSGKSTWAYEQLVKAGSLGKKATLREADQYFCLPDGTYSWNGALLPKAHQWCYEQVKFDMDEAVDEIYVCNTFTRLSEMISYRVAANSAGYRCVEVNFFDSGLSDEILAKRTVHSVPQATILKMRARFER